MLTSIVLGVDRPNPKENIPCFYDYKEIRIPFKYNMTIYTSILFFTISNEH